ncbi:MAG TPA: BTAD domain-containing putative transcriptional regulator [Acidimicrobiales bacterium]|nr:BTAD domain-containing putative transcriptional regulator [Acidimicrobiales bacterium]
MPRSFRFEPPEPRPGSLTRPRLLRILLGRWDHRVTSVVGGPGLGKTTLLAQAVAENRLAPRGEDVWIGVEQGDADGVVLSRDVMAAVRAEGRDRAAGTAPDTTGEAPDPAAVADAVWRRAPAALCLVVDDVHWLTPGSQGAIWLTALVDVMPANGHVLLASRWSPAVPLAGLATPSAVLRLAEDDLRFTDEELAGFAARRGIAIGRLDHTGGWPAMAELAASVGHDLAGDYLWEEVLEPLGPERRRVLAVLSDLGGADEGLAGAALGAPVDLARVLDGVPLVARGADGWRVPHPLWHGVPALTLADDERTSARRGAVDHLVAEHRYDEAVALAREVGIVDVVPGILRAACIGPHRPSGRQLDRWLADLPEAVRDTAGVALAAGVKAALLAPADATEPLQTAIRRCREAGDPIGELGAIALLGQVAWWRADVGLLAGLFPRVVELEAEGHPLARALAALGQAVVADMTGGDDDVLAHLDAIEPGVLDDAWEAMAAWLRATTLAGGGRPEESLAVFDAIPPIPDPAFQLNVAGARLEALWALGQLDEVVAAAPSITDGLAAAGVVQFVLVSLAETAFVFAWVGDVEGARGLVERVQRTGGDADVGQSARLALAEAAMLVAAGDEPAAADVLERAIAIHGLDNGIDRRVWRRGLALSYVLVPSARDRWDAAELRGHVAGARTLARAVVALRDRANRAVFGARGADEVRLRLRDLDLSDMSRVRAGLPHRFAVDLALGLEAAGRPEAGTLLDALGGRGREAVRAEAATRTHRAKIAKSLLATVPAPPAERTEIAVLGRLAVVRNGQPVTDGDLRRERVRALLAFLVGHRKTSRAAIMRGLWPDLGELAAANNLRVTMTYLLRVLEPGRSARESAYLVRLDGQAVTLVTSDWLRIDVDEFDQHVADAARAEADGSPSVALEHNLAAVGLYRGEAHEGLADADWIVLEREHYRRRFVAAATRAGELLVGRGDVDEAERVARRAVEVDPWSEAAYAVLVSVALARGDRSAARRTLDGALAALSDLGVEPSEETRRLRRLVRGRGGEAA